MLSTPLTMLLWSSILMFILILVPAGAAIMRNGAIAQAGPRDSLPEPSTFMKRANRLNANMRENMILFAALILIASAADISHEKIDLGAQIFFYSRAVHAVLYLAAIPLVRPLAWFASVVGMVMIALQLLAA